MKISRLLTDSEKTETLNRYLKEVKELSFALTAEEEAQLIGITRERVRQIRNSSLLKLKDVVSEEFRFFES